MGPDRTAVARKRTTRRPVARPPRGGERHPVEAAYGGSLARPARALRTLANLLRSLLPLAQGRHLGPATGRCPNQDRRGRRGRVAGQRGQHHRSGAPACRGCPPKAEQARRKKGVLAPRGRGARAQPRRANDQAASGLRRQGPAAVGGRDPGPAPREHPVEAVLDAIRVKRPGGVGRPSKRPTRLIADRGYSYPSCRLLLRQRGIRHMIPERRDQREHRAGRPGAPPRFDLDVYRKRNVAERCVNRFKQWRGIATRYEKRAANYRAMVVIAALMIWLSS